MTPPPPHVSKKDLPNHVYALPDNMAPQPLLTRYWCRNSITRLTTQAKSAPDGTTRSFADVFRRPEGYATRKNNFGICNSCQSAKSGGCIEIDPYFRRACNIFDWLVDRALRKHNEETARLGDGATDDDVYAVTLRYFQTAFDYAKLCREAFVEYDKVLARKIKDSGMTEMEYHKARQVSREHNLERYSAALGTVGQKAPMNVVVDKDLEAHFTKTGRANNAERRWYYYGTDVPDAAEAPAAPFQRLSLSESPTKRVSSGRRLSDESV